MKNFMTRYFKNLSDDVVEFVYFPDMIVKNVDYDGRKISINQYPIDGPECFRAVKSLKELGYQEFYEKR